MLKRATLALVAAALVTAPTATADYTDEDMEFIGQVGPALKRILTPDLIDSLIADGHKVCAMMEAGDWNSIQSYIQNKYDTDGAYPLHFFSWGAADVYCPQWRQVVGEAGI